MELEFASTSDIIRELQSRKIPFIFAAILPEAHPERGRGHKYSHSAVSYSMPETLALLGLVRILDEGLTQSVLENERHNWTEITPEEEGDGNEAEGAEGEDG